MMKQMREEKEECESEREKLRMLRDSQTRDLSLSPEAFATRSLLLQPVPRCRGHRMQVRARVLPDNTNGKCHVSERNGEREKGASESWYLPELDMP